MSEKTAGDIQRKYEEEDKRSAMAIKMAEEEKRRQDLNVEHWDGIQSNKAYRIPVGRKKWSEMGPVARIFFVIGVMVFAAVVCILIFTAIKSFSM